MEGVGWGHSLQQPRMKEEKGGGGEDRSTACRKEENKRKVAMGNGAGAACV